MSQARDRLRTRQTRKRSTFSRTVDRSVSAELDVSEDEDVVETPPRRRWIGRRSHSGKRARNNGAAEDAMSLESRQTITGDDLVDVSSDSEDEIPAVSSPLPGSTVTTAAMPTLTAVPPSIVRGGMGAAPAPPAVPNILTPAVVSQGSQSDLSSVIAANTYQQPTITSVASAPTSIVTVVRPTPVSDTIIPGQPNKGVVDSEPSYTDALSAIETSQTFSVTDTVQAIQATESPDFDDDDKDYRGPPPRALDPTAEHLLIAAGAIGKRNRL
jgi:hypothetical protein